MKIAPVSSSAALLITQRMPSVSLGNYKYKYMQLRRLVTDLENALMSGQGLSVIPFSADHAQFPGFRPLSESDCPLKTEN